jgi:hypothetical protein
MLELTRNDIDRGTIDSIGRATYAKPVPLWRAGAGGGAKLLASFTTSFTFRITPDPRQPNTGDGMAFFLTPYPSATEIPPGSGGGNLGLLAGGNSTGDSRFVFVAVEFDTWYNGLPADINGNHMGIHGLVRRAAPGADLVVQFNTRIVGDHSNDDDTCRWYLQ